MCRLFALSGGNQRVHATFWLLEAPDSLSNQSRREPDGTGIGWFEATGRPRVAKQPLAAYEDAAFAREAREISSTTFVAHVRYATTGDVLAQNTHPFLQRDRLFAHNGVIQDLARLDRELGDARALVQGDTDSERLFALITREVERAGGDVGTGIIAAARWVAANLPVFSLNLVLATYDELWALRYPDTHELWVLERPAGGTSGDRHLDGAGAAGTIHVRSTHLMEHGSVIVASERLDHDSGWRLLDAGEILHVLPSLEVRSERALVGPPTHPLTLSDLEPRAANAQAPTA
jgi:predicted glutamine amidotransferase